MAGMIQVDKKNKLNHHCLFGMSLMYTRDKQFAWNIVHMSLDYTCYK